MYKINDKVIVVTDERIYAAVITNVHDDYYTVDSIRGNYEHVLIMPEDVYPIDTSLATLMEDYDYTFSEVDLTHTNVTTIQCRPDAKIHRLIVSECSELTTLTKGPIALAELHAEYSSVTSFDYRNAAIHTLQLAGCYIESFRGVPMCVEIVIDENSQGLLYLVGRCQHLYTKDQYRELELTGESDEIEFTPSIFKAKLELLKQGFNGATLQ